MSDTLIHADIPAQDINTMLNAFSSAGPTFDSPFSDENSSLRIKGNLHISLAEAKSDFRLGALRYGPIDTIVTIEDFTVKIDWHNIFHIPHDLCLEIKDPCGDTLVKECVHIDLGISKIHLISNLNIPLNPTVELLEVKFTNQPGDFYSLVGKLPILTTLADGLAVGFAKGLAESLENWIDKLLHSIFGDNPISDLFIDLLKVVFKLVDLALDLLGKLIALALQPIDTLIQQLCGDLLEITLKADAFPKNFPVLSKTDDRTAVTIAVEPEPKITFLQSGIQLEIYG